MMAGVKELNLRGCGHLGGLYRSKSLQTQDERVYGVISRRLKDKFDIFGGLPDTIEDDWIETAERLEAMMDEYVHLRQSAHDTFELRYKETIDPDKNRWELCSRVLARKDVVEKLSESW